MPGCILTAVEGVHASDHEVWIENVRMYLTEAVCVSGFYSALIPNLVEYLFRT